MKLRGRATFVCWGLRGATLRRSGATKIRLWIRAAEKPCHLPVIRLLAELPDSRRCEWRWTAPPEEPLGLEWQAIDMALDEFEYVGIGSAPVEMLSAALGQLRISTAVETNVYLDDIEAM